MVDGLWWDKGNKERGGGMLVCFKMGSWDVSKWIVGTFQLGM
jgi:hypothetical protein